MQKLKKIGKSCNGLDKSYMHILCIYVDVCVDVSMYVCIHVYVYTKFYYILIKCVLIITFYKHPGMLHAVNKVIAIQYHLASQNHN